MGQEGRVSLGTRFISQVSVLGTGCGLPGAAVSEAPGAQAKRLTPQIVQPVTTPCTRHSTLKGVFLPFSATLTEA